MEQTIPETLATNMVIKPIPVARGMENKKVKLDDRKKT